MTISDERIATRERVEKEIDGMILRNAVEEDRPGQAMANEVADRQEQRKLMAEDRRREELTRQWYFYHVNQLKRHRATFEYLMDQHRRRRDECARTLGWHVGGVEEDEDIREVA